MPTTTSALQVYDVSVYGAVEGTGGSGTTNQSKIQAAITAAQTAGGGIVFFPAGLWLVTGGLTVNGPVTIQGAGQGRSLVQQQMSATTTIKATGSGFNLFDIEIEHNVTDDGTAVYLDDTSNVCIERVNFYLGNYAISTTTVSGLYIRGVRVTMDSGCVAVINLTGNDSAASQEIHVFDTVMGGNGHGIGVAFRECSNSWWSNCDIKGFLQNLAFIPKYGNCVGHYVSNCTFDVAEQSHAYLVPGTSGSGFSVQDVRFSACWFGVSTSYSIYLLGADSTETFVSGISFEDCKVTHGTGLGYYLGEYVSYVLIQGGSVQVNASGGVKIAGAVNWLQIQNVAFNDADPGETPTGNQEFSIQFAAECTNVVISDCDCTPYEFSVGPPPVYKNGISFTTNPGQTTSIVNCRGYNDQGTSFTPAISNGSSYSASNSGEYYGPVVYFVAGTPLSSIEVGSFAGTLVSVEQTLGIYPLEPNNVINVSWLGPPAPTIVAIGA